MSSAAPATGHAARPGGTGPSPRSCGRRSPGAPGRTRLRDRRPAAWCHRLRLHRRHPRRRHRAHAHGDRHPRRPPLVAASSLGARALGTQTAAWRAGCWAGASPPRRRSAAAGLIGWVRSALTDAASWPARASLVLKLLVSVLSFSSRRISGWAGGLPDLSSSPWPISPGRRPRRGVTTWTGDHAWPRGNFHILTLPGTFLIHPHRRDLVARRPWATRRRTPLDLALIRELLAGIAGPASARAGTDLAYAGRRLPPRYAASNATCTTARRPAHRHRHETGLARKRLGTSDDAAGPDLPAAGPRPGQRRAPQRQGGHRRPARPGRGIHPPILDTGLAAGLADLVVRSTSRRRGRSRTAAPVAATGRSPTTAPPSCWPTSPSTAAPGTPRSRPSSCLTAATAVTDDGAGNARRPTGRPGRTRKPVRTVDGRNQISSLRLDCGDY